MQGEKKRCPIVRLSFPGRERGFAIFGMTFAGVNQIRSERFQRRSLFRSRPVQRFPEPKQIVHVRAGLRADVQMQKTGQPLTSRMATRQATRILTLLELSIPLRMLLKELEQSPDGRLGPVKVVLVSNRAHFSLHGIGRGESRGVRNTLFGMKGRIEIVLPQSDVRSACGVSFAVAQRPDSPPRHLARCDSRAYIRSAYVQSD